jgi:uncharacterized membrane-anchored protein YitT (DUF2179 family)
MIPCQIVTGSVSGLAILVSELFGIGDSMVVLVLNLSCLAIGVRFLGNRFGLRCIYISVLLPLFMALLPQNEALLFEHQALNIAAFLVLLTIGQCIMLKLDTTSGGLDTIAEVMARRLHASTGLMIAACGIFVSVLTIGIYGLSVAVLGALVTLANGALINGVMHLQDLASGMIRHSAVKANA